MVELAISAPVLMFLLFGAFNVTVMVSDRVIAGYACRQGARLATEIGGQLTNPTLTTAQVDQYIVRNVLAVARSMNYSTLQEIDIYKPLSADGQFNPGTDPYDKFDGSGTLVSSTFPLASRIQIPPSETSIGLRLVWRYNPPTGTLSFSLQLSEFAVMKASPVLL